MTNDLIDRQILVVEDEFLIAKALSDLLLVAGAVVLGPVATTQRALALLAQTERLDAAVIDINLRGETGFGVADTLVARAVPFVFATGYTASSIPERFRDVGILQKPLRSDIVINALTVLIGSVAQRPSGGRPAETKLP